MNLLRIKKKSEETGIAIRTLSAKIEMSEQNLHRCIREGRIEAGDLEKIAQVLEVPVSYFFDEAEQLTGSKERKSCQGCKDKQKIIRLLEDKIDLLEEKLESFEENMSKKVG
jgi:transcriptional regulator with XRE-family HTH domain